MPVGNRNLRYVSIRILASDRRICEVKCDQDGILRNSFQCARHTPRRCDDEVPCCSLKGIGVVALKGKMAAANGDSDVFNALKQVYEGWLRSFSSVGAARF